MRQTMTCGCVCVCEGVTLIGLLPEHGAVSVGTQIHPLRPGCALCCQDGAKGCCPEHPLQLLAARRRPALIFLLAPRDLGDGFGPFASPGPLPRHLVERGMGYEFNLVPRLAIDSRCFANEGSLKRYCKKLQEQLKC